MHHLEVVTDGTLLALIKPHLRFGTIIDFQQKLKEWRLQNISRKKQAELIDRIISKPLSNHRQTNGLSLKNTMTQTLPHDLTENNDSAPAPVAIDQIRRESRAVFIRDSKDVSATQPHGGPDKGPSMGLAKKTMPLRSTPVNPLSSPRPTSDGNDNRAVQVPKIQRHRVTIKTNPGVITRRLAATPIPLAESPENTTDERQNTLPERNALPTESCITDSSTRTTAVRPKPQLESVSGYIPNA